MPRIPILTALATLVLAGIALAQPTLDSLWPNDDGLAWEYNFHIVNTVEGIDFSSVGTLGFEGTHQVPGGTAQVLLADHGDVPGQAHVPSLPPLLRAVWQARPDLRDAIAERHAGTVRDGVWWPLFLHDGYYLETEQDLEMWQDFFLHPTWIYATAGLTVGATFVHQLVPEFADNIFLHGTVGALDDVVSTPAGEFVGTVRMDYRIDFGWQDMVDEQGNLIAQIRSETTGWVHYAPFFGPVDLREEHTPYVEIEGTGYPPEWDDLLGQVVQTQTLVLTSGTTPVQSRSLSDVKALFR